MNTEMVQEIDKLGGAVEKHKPLYRSLLNFWSEYGVPSTEPLAVEDWCIDISSYPEYLNSSLEEKFRTSLVINQCGMDAHCTHNQFNREI